MSVNPKYSVQAPTYHRCAGPWIWECVGENCCLVVTLQSSSSECATCVYSRALLLTLCLWCLMRMSDAVMFANIGPADRNVSETISTLRYVMSGLKVGLH